VSVVTRRATHRNPHLNEHNLGGKCRDKLTLAAVHTNNETFRGAAGLFSTLFHHCLCFVVHMTCSSYWPHLLYPTSLGQWPVNRNISADFIGCRIKLFTSSWKTDLTSSPCGPKFYLSHIFIPVLEILLTQSLLSRCSLPCLLLQALCADINAYQYLFGTSCSGKQLW